MPSQLQEYEAGQLSVGREDGQETKEGQSQELNNGVEAEFEEAPQEISLVTFADHHTAGELELQSMGQLASAFGVPQETALKWLAPPRVAAAASLGGIGVGAVIFTPSSGEINYLGVGGQHSGCGAAAALVRFAEEATQVADLFIVPRDGAARRFWWRAGYTASGSSSTVTGRVVKKGAPRPVEVSHLEGRLPGIQRKVLGVLGNCAWCHDGTEDSPLPTSTPLPPG